MMIQSKAARIRSLVAARPVACRRAAFALALAAAGCIGLEGPDGETCPAGFDCVPSAGADPRARLAGGFQDDPDGAIDGEGGSSAAGRGPGAEAASAEASADASAVVTAVAGTLYDAGTAVFHPQLGAGFTIPRGWRGALSDGVFVMEDGRLQASVLVTGDAGTLEQAVELLAGDVDLGGGAFMSPEGQVTVDGSTASNRFRVSGVAPADSGYLKAVVGGRDWTLAFVGLSDASGFDAMLAAIDEAAATVSFDAPPAATSEASALGGSRWTGALGGQLIHRYYTVSDYSEHEQIWLCSDGRAARSFNGGGARDGFSLASQAGNTGRWAASDGPGGSGTLTIQYDDGGVASWSLSAEDGGLYLDGSRWYREPTSCD